MLWNRLKYKNGITNVVSDELCTVVREDMEQRTPPGLLESTEVEHEICLEQGGPCSTKRPFEEFLFHSLTIWVPSEDLATLVPRWENTPLQRTFYRFTAWPWQCLVVDPEQRLDLLKIFNARVDLAERRAAEFWADHRSPQEVLRAYNESRGAVIPYGLDKIARFRAKSHN
jgi:hypothetical protein